jgi:hypothetical protein
MEAKGDPKAPLSAAEVSQKFADCLDYGGVAPANGRHLRKLLSDIDGINNMARLTHAMR